MVLFRRPARDRHRTRGENRENTDMENTETNEVLRTDAGNSDPGGNNGAGSSTPSVNTGTDTGEVLPFWPRLLRLARRTAQDWRERSVGTYASSIAFFFFMSMIPLLIILIQLLPLAGLSQNDLIAFVEQLIPETLYWLAGILISEAYRQSGAVMSVSAVALIWAASRGTMALRKGLNRVYGEKERRSRPVIFMLAIGYTAALLVIFSIMLYLLFVGPVSSYLAAAVPGVFSDPIRIALKQKILLHLLVVLLFTLIYTFIPTGRRKIQRQIPGAIIVTFLWDVFSKLFSIYIQGYNAYTMFYGSLGAIAILLFWLYCCFYIPQNRLT